MSRSVKRIPGFIDNNRSKKFWKRYSNKLVRRSIDISNGSYFKKIFGCGIYNICDWKFLYWSRQNLEYELNHIYYTGKLYRAYMK